MIQPLNKPMEAFPSAWECDRSISKWNCKNGLKADFAKGKQCKNIWRLDQETWLLGFTLISAPLGTNLAGHAATSAPVCNTWGGNTAFKFRSVCMCPRICFTSLLLPTHMHHVPLWEDGLDTVDTLPWSSPSVQKWLNLNKTNHSLNISLPATLGLRKPDEALWKSVVLRCCNYSTMLEGAASRVLIIHCTEAAKWLQRFLRKEHGHSRLHCSCMGQMWNVEVQLEGRTLKTENLEDVSVLFQNNFFPHSHPQDVPPCPSELRAHNNLTLEIYD